MLSVQIKLILAFVGYSLALIGYDSTTKRLHPSASSGLLRLLFEKLVAWSHLFDFLLLVFLLLEYH